MRDDEDDGVSRTAISKLIESKFGHSRRRQYDEKGDVEEAGFDQIEREEMKSAKIARKEDDRELRMLMDEEKRRERLRLAKMVDIS